MRVVVVRDDAHKLKCVIAIVGPDRHRRDDVVNGHAGGVAVTGSNHTHSDALARAVRVFNINLVIVIERDIVEKHVPVTGLALGEMVIEAGPITIVSTATAAARIIAVCIPGRVQSNRSASRLSSTRYPGCLAFRNSASRPRVRPESSKKDTERTRHPR